MQIVNHNYKPWHTHTHIILQWTFNHHSIWYMDHKKMNTYRIISIYLHNIINIESILNIINWTKHMIHAYD